MGVADGFAMDRLAAPVKLRRPPKGGPRDRLGRLRRGLAHQIAGRFRPDVVIGVAKGGVFVGAARSPPRSAWTSSPSGSRSAGATPRR